MIARSTYTARRRPSITRSTSTKPSEIKKSTQNIKTSVITMRRLRLSLLMSSIRSNVVAAEIARSDLSHYGAYETASLSSSI